MCALVSRLFRGFGEISVWVLLAFVVVRNFRIGNGGLGNGDCKWLTDLASELAPTQSTTLVNAKKGGRLACSVVVGEPRGTEGTTQRGN